MSYKNLSILLLLAVFAISSHAEEEFDPWKCSHGQQEREEPTLIDIEEDYNPEGNDHSGRLLTSYSNMRTYGYYGLLNSASSTMRNYVENELIPPLLDYFSAALKVKYPVSGNMKVSTSTICGVSTPSVLKSGVAADYVYFVSVDSSSSYVASSSTCSLASGSKRPLVGHTTISTAYMSATSDVLLHERNMLCIMHEVIHTLGFSSSLYSNWLNYETGKTLTGHVTTASAGGNSYQVINAEPLTSKLRSFFGCSSLKGAYLENDGGSGTAGVHFERRQYGFEIMTSGLIYQMQMSELTLALLESTGWYVADYSYADPFFFGQGEGCSFITDTCSAANSQFADLCTSSARTCTNTGRGAGSCATDSRSGGCKWVHPDVEYDCENTGAESYARLPGIQTFGRGENSKCFTGTLNSKSAGSTTSFCFKYTCSGSGSGTELTLNLAGGKNLVCTSKGAKAISGYGGTINCPDPLTFCNTIGEKVCPRGCMGRGTCVSGKCSCHSGYKGEDCALNA